MNNDKLKKLDSLFKPKSIALIGASRDEKSVGHGILRNLVKGCNYECRYCMPFEGKIFPVNPNASEILGLKCYPSIKSIRDEIDLAIIAVPSKIVPFVAKECAEKKVKAVVVISAGFAELNGEGKKLQEELLKILRKANIPLVGPNCLGIIRPASKMNASFAPTTPPEGNVAFVSQSGALADSIIDWAIEARYGFSTIISYGNKADLDVHDFMRWLEKDKETRVITLYIEGIDDGRKFIEVASKTARKKPVIALKAGRTDAGIKAISSHTGSLAGSYNIYLAAFKQSGVLAADTIEEMFDNAKAFANQPLPKLNSIAIVTNGGGCGVMCADYCESFGVKLAELKPTTIKKLDKSGKMHPACSRKNPLDIVGDALPERYEAAINILLAENYIYGLIVIQTLQTMTDPLENAKIIIEAKKKHPEKPIICVYMGGKFSKEGSNLLEQHGIPDYNDLRKAAKAMEALVRRAEFLKRK